MSKLTLYMTPGSPPARAVLLFIRYLGIDVEIKFVNVLTGEQHTPAYLKLNPAHEVPVLVEDDFVLTESRAILQYLANSRKPGSDLYPNEPRARARVDQRLSYDSALFFKNSLIIRPLLSGAVKQVSQQARDAVKESLTVIEKILKSSKWIAADHLTIADFSLLTSITTLAEVGYDLTQHAHVNRWYQQCQSLPGFEENRDGAKLLAARVKSGAEGSIF